MSIQARPLSFADQVCQNNKKTTKLKNFLDFMEKVVPWEGVDSIPDETTILNFRHLLERHKLGEAILEEVNTLFLTSTLSHLNTLILFAMNLKLHTTAFAFMSFCYCFYLIFTTAVDLFVFAQILPRPNTFAQRRRAHQLSARSGINRLLLTCSLQRHQ